MAWDLLGLLFLFYDAVITPWQLAFGELSSAEARVSRSRLEIASRFKTYKSKSFQVVLKIISLAVNMIYQSHLCLY